MRIIAVTEAARRHKDLAATLCRLLVDFRPHQRRKRIRRIILLCSVFLLGIRRLLLFRGLIRLPVARRSQQQQRDARTQATIAHPVSPPPHDFRFFTYS